MKRLIVILAVLSVVGAAPLFSQNVIDLTEDSSPLKEINVTNQGLTFVPAEIRVRRGDTLRLTFEVRAGFHDWKLDAFSASTRQLSRGQKDTVEFVVDRAGTFEYYCSVGNHRAQGMVGRLIVIE